MLNAPEVQEKLSKELKEIAIPAQLSIDGITKEPDYASIVAKTTQLYTETMIDIPKIVLTPTNDIGSGFNDVDLDLSSVNYQPVSEEILIHYLQSNERETLATAAVAVAEPIPENYIVRHLMNKEEISYDDQADLLYKLAGQAVSHIRSYLPTDEVFLNVLQRYQQDLAELVYSQMMKHYWETPSEFQVSVTKGFTALRANTFQAIAGTEAQNFRLPPANKSQIKSMYFSGFKKCCYQYQKFDSDTERQFAVIIEDCKDVLKWMKPGPGQFRIDYKRGQSYEPDFVVETTSRKFLCEPKAADDIASEEVTEKAKAAIAWCNHANTHAKENNGKEWNYILIPHTSITTTTSFESLVATCTRIK
jgi:type III restriction enzyme